MMMVQNEISDHRREEHERKGKENLIAKQMKKV
jgi:hypothetical protein